MKKKLLSIFLSLTMVITMMSMATATASAAPHKPPKPPVEQEQDDYEGQYADQKNPVYYISYTVGGDGKLTKSEPKCETYDYVTADTTAIGDANGKWYVVNGMVNISERIIVTGTANLILKDGASLTVSNGITLETGNCLNIYAQSGGGGCLIANVLENYSVAAIGGYGLDKTCGEINIYGGTITATGGFSSAGIGGSNGGDGGAVTIYDGTVTATGGNMKDGTAVPPGAGIGGAGNGNGGTVTIYGGTVTAMSGKNGDISSFAGIGGNGIGATNGTLTVKDGVICKAGDNENSATVCTAEQALGKHYFHSELPYNSATLNTAPVAAENLTYDGNDHALLQSAGTATNGTMMYSLDNTTWSAEIPVGKNAGEYTVYYMVKGSDSYDDLTNDNYKLTVTIAKAALTATASSHTVAYGTAAPTYTVSYTGWVKGEETPTTAAALTSNYTTTSDVGEYAVTFETTPVFVNYAVTTENGKVTVVRAKTAVEPTVADGLVYTGEAQNGYTNAGTHVTLSETSSATDVGNYQFKATPESNYAWEDGSTDAKTYEWSIGKADMVVGTNILAPSVPIPLVYDGNAQELLCAGQTWDEKDDAPFGTFYYSVDGENWSINLPTAINAGKYNPVWYFVGDGNHNNIGSAEAPISQPDPVEILKTGPAAAPSVTASDVTATEDTVTLPYEATYEYQMDNGEWQSGEGKNIFTGLDPATQHTFKVRVKETETAMPSNEATITVYTAAEMPTNVTATGTVSYTDETFELKDGYEISTKNGTGSGNTFEDGKLTPDANKKVTLEPNTTYYIRKAATTTPAVPASEAVELAIPARPAAPAASAFTKTEETVENKKDGSFNGITEAMEYSTDRGTTWISGPATLTGLSNETIKVRTKATESSFVSEEYSYTFTASNIKLTVTMGDNKEEVVYGGKVTKPETDPVKEGCTFGGWYKDEECTKAWNFGADNVEKDITLYAKWIENDVPKIAISGNVTEGGANVPNATVELLLGTIKVAAAMTNANGLYSFDNVENGTYNIVVTKYDGKTKTEMVTISDSSVTVDVELPTSEINSKVEHKGSEVPDAKSDISKTVAGGLDKVAENHMPQNDGDKVTVKLTVEPKNATDVDCADEIKNEAGNGKKVEFLDLSLMMQTNNDTPVDIGKNNEQLLTIIIPFDFTTTNVNSVMILRKHGEDNAEKLNMNPEDGKEGYIVDEKAGTITIYAMKFSDYAIAYDDLKSYSVSAQSDGHGVAAVTIGGETVAKADKDSSVVFTATPNSGYEFDYWEVVESGITLENEKQNPITVTMPDKDLTLKAHFRKQGGEWHPIVPIIPIGPIVPVDKYYTVSFDMQSIGDAIDPITVQKGSKLAVQDTPIAEGYEFGGWFKEAECINAWDFDKDTVKSNMTLYAKWTKVEEPTPVEPEKVSVLLVKGAKSGDKAIKLSWNKVEGATKYVVYGNSCGKDVKKLKTTTGKTYTVKKIAGKKLAAHKVYKFYVVAYTPDGKVKSKTIHFITANTKGKYANVKSIKAKKTSLELSVGESGKIGATYKMYSGKKHLGKEYGKALRYISDCPEVASVSSTGKVLARQAGTATIYIQDVGGKYCKTTVTVK